MIAVGVRQLATLGEAGLIEIPEPPRGFYQAGAVASRVTGFSTIGNLITATSARTGSTATTPDRRNRAVERNAAEPDAEKPPTWWLKNASPDSVASQRVPKMTAMMPLVAGTRRATSDRAEADTWSASPETLLKASIAAARPNK